MDEKKSGGGHVTGTDDTPEEAMDRLIETGSSFTGDGKDRFYCISIIGQVEGHYVLDNNQKTTKYDHLLPLLVALEESEKVDGVLILLNTMGGDVEAGLAIAELIASLSKPTVSIVLGGGHSIGVPLAVSAKTSFIVPSATMTIHPVRTSGTIIHAPQTYHYLRDMQARIVRFITGHSRVTEEVLTRMMNSTDDLTNDIGSVIDGEEAVACGLIDRIGGIADALTVLREACYGTKEKETPCGNNTSTT